MYFASFNIYFLHQMLHQSEWVTGLALRMISPSIFFLPLLLPHLLWFMDGELALLAFELIGFKYIRRFTYWSVSQLRLMCLPSGRPKHPSRLESYFKRAAWSQGGELVVLEGGEKMQRWKELFISLLFIIPEVKFAGMQAGDRWGLKWAGEWEGLVRWTVYRGQGCHWHALHVMYGWPWFRGKTLFRRFWPAGSCGADCK